MSVMRVYNLQLTVRFPRRRIVVVYTLRFLPYTTLYIFTLTFIFKYLTIATPMPAIKCPAHLSVCYYKPFVSASKRGISYLK